MRAEQKERTRLALIAEARRLFAERGYADVGLAEITAAAGVTKGALYHQFDGKTALFRAVLEAVHNEVADRIVAASDGDPWEGFVAGCRAFLVASTDPALQRILLIDGPAVLGWAEWRAFDEATSAFHLEEAITDLMRQGLLPQRPAAPLTRLLSGAMNEAALWLATEPSALDDTLRTLTELLESLRGR
ncbi:TetR/AcrR family transcriptional regulator [Herbidospora sp. RD11066]